MSRIWRTIAALLMAFHCCPAEAHADARELGLVPAPQSIRMTGGTRPLEGEWTIDVLTGCPDDSVAARELALEWERWKGTQPAVRLEKRLPSRRNAILITIDDQPTKARPTGEESYELEVSKDCITIHGGAAGRFYAVQTLRQLIRSHGGAPLPCLRIEDSPALRWRGISDDISRGQMPTMADFGHQLERMGYYKLNLYFLYIEDTFVFRANPAIGAGGARLTGRELAWITAEGRRHQVTVVPIFESLSHQERLLSLPSTRRYAEERTSAWPIARHCESLAGGASAIGDATGLVGVGPSLLAMVVSRAARWVACKIDDSAPMPWSFSPVDAGARAFVRTLMGEIARACPGPFFHLGGDEATDLGSGSSRSAAAQTSPLAVEADYLAGQAKYLRESEGRQVMCYSDPILLDPKAFVRLDRSTILIDWHYNPDARFGSVDSLRAAGFERVLPSGGVWNWRTFCPDFGRASRSLASAAEAAKRGKLLGCVAASWGDGGAECLRETNWPAYAEFAAASWQPKAPRDSEFAHRFATSWWGPPGTIMEPILDALRRVDISDLGWGGRLYARPIDVRVRNAPWLLRMRQLSRSMRPARIPWQAVGPSSVEDPLARGLELAARRFAFVADRESVLSRVASDPPGDTSGSTPAREGLARLTVEARWIEGEYSVLWLLQNRPLGLAVPLGRLRRQTAQLDSLSALPEFDLASRRPDAGGARALARAPRARCGS